MIPHALGRLRLLLIGLGARVMKSLRRLETLLSAVPPSKSMPMRLAFGKRLRSSPIVPRPVMWLGRHPKGCRHTTLSTPEARNSAISAVSSQPSPACCPGFTRPSTRSR